MDDIRKLYNSCKKSKYGKVLIKAVEEMYKLEIIQTGMYHNEIGENNNYKDKEDWCECRIIELFGEVIKWNTYTGSLKESNAESSRWASRM